MILPFDNPLFLIPSSSGLIFMLVGFVMLKFPSKKINSLYGYRTNSSIKNQERWKFAQKYSSIEMIKLGGLLTLSAIIGIVYNPKGKIGMFLGLGLMILMVIFLLIRVEKSIKKKFKNE
jgi:immunity protein, SdpI family